MNLYKLKKIKFRKNLIPKNDNIFFTLDFILKSKKNFIFNLKFSG